MLVSLSGSGVDVCRYDVRAFACKSQCDGPAHASTGAGDHRNLLIELHLSHLLDRPTNLNLA